MTIDEVISTLGLDEETSKLLRTKVSAEKAAGLRQQRELDALQTRATALETELVGDGKQGARNYKQWYDENFSKVQRLQNDYQKYVERYGDINTTATTTTTSSTTTGLTKEDVAKLIQETYNPLTERMSIVLKGSAKVIEKHMRAGRKSELDWDKLGELAAANGGNLNAAYEEWDKPAREESAKAATEAEIEKRVKAELAKRQTAEFFPSADAVSSGISPLARDRGSAPKYDRNKVVESAITGLYEPATVN